MTAYVVFQEVDSGVPHLVSKNSLDYPDYQLLESKGHYISVFEGRKADCEDKCEELNEELQNSSL